MARALMIGVLGGMVLAATVSLMVAKGCPAIDWVFERDPMASF